MGLFRRYTISLMIEQESDIFKKMEAPGIEPSKKASAATETKRENCYGATPIFPLGSKAPIFDGAFEPKGEIGVAP